MSSLAQTSSTTLKLLQCFVVALIKTYISSVSRYNENQTQSYETCVFCA